MKYKIVLHPLQKPGTNEPLYAIMRVLDIAGAARWVHTTDLPRGGEETPHSCYIALFETLEDAQHVIPMLAVLES